MKEKICEFCKEPFIPNSSHQRYCKRSHYMNCPVCGKKYLVTNNENLKRPPVACSYECRVKRTQKTSMEKYGTKAPGNNPEARKKAKETNLEKLGVEYPMQSERIRDKSKETIIDKYGVDNVMKCKEIKNKAENTNIEKYGSKTFLTSEIGKQKINSIMIEKYGTIHPIQNENIRNKIIDTNIKRYGSGFFVGSDIGRESIHQSVMKKYGVDYVTQLEKVKEKTVKTSLKKYGTTNPAKSEEVKEKIRKSFFNKYGVNSVMEVPEIREKIMKTTTARHGVPFYVMKNEVRMSSGAISKINLNFAKRLDESNIDYIMEYRIERKGFDFYLPRYNMLVELNPSYTHSLIGNHYTNKGKDIEYHKNKWVLSNSNGFDCRCLFDWDDYSTFIEELKATTILPMDDMQVFFLKRSVSIEFFKKYGRNRIDSYPHKMMTVGIIQDGNIMQAVAVGYNSYKELADKQYLILNYGIRWGFQCNEGYKLIFNQINNLIEPSDIYLEVDADRSVCTEIIQLNLKKKLHTTPRIFWSKGNKRIKCSLSRIAGSHYVDEGWLPVADCGKIIYDIVD